jgi:hypothetical protein
LEKAGFEFDLVAEGRDAIPIDRKASCGSVSSGDGTFQGFYVCLSEPSANQIAPGVSYSLRPKRTNQEYFWTVLPTALLRRPDGKALTNSPRNISQWTQVSAQQGGITRDADSWRSKRCALLEGLASEPATSRASITSSKKWRLWRSGAPDLKFTSTVTPFLLLLAFAPGRKRP